MTGVRRTGERDGFHRQGRGYSHRPLLPGTVFAVDPQMWIPEERLYVRVEDTVAITEAGVENLTHAAPLELNDVEALMREAGTHLAYLLTE